MVVGVAAGFLGIKAATTILKSFLASQVPLKQGSVDVYPDSLIGRMAEYESNTRRLFDPAQVSAIVAPDHWAMRVTSATYDPIYRTVDRDQWREAPLSFEARYDERVVYWLELAPEAERFLANRAAWLWESFSKVHTDTVDLMNDFIGAMASADANAAVKLVLKSEITLPQINEEMTELASHCQSNLDVGNSLLASLDSLSKTIAAFEDALLDLQSLFAELDRSSAGGSMTSFSARLEAGRLSLKLRAIQTVLDDIARVIPAQG